MPVRENPNREKETREFQKGNFITREKWEWEEGDKRKKEYAAWNKGLENALSAVIKKWEKARPEIIIQWEARSFNNINEGIGKELFRENRNYLAKEVVEMEVDFKKKSYFAGEYLELEKLIDQINKDISEQIKTVDTTPETEPDSGSSENDTPSNRRRRRKARPPRDTE